MYENTLRAHTRTHTGKLSSCLVMKPYLCPLAVCWRRGSPLECDGRFLPAVTTFAGRHRRERRWDDAKTRVEGVGKRENATYSMKSEPVEMAAPSLYSSPVLLTWRFVAVMNMWRLPQAALYSAAAQRRVDSLALQMDGWLFFIRAPLLYYYLMKFIACANGFYCCSGWVS